jgi:hypothetical protein
VIAKDFIIAKDFYTYTIIILRQDKSLRDHAPTRLIRRALCGVSAARWAWDETGQLGQLHRFQVNGVADSWKIKSFSSERTLAPPFWQP